MGNSEIYIKILISINAEFSIICTHERVINTLWGVDNSFFLFPLAVRLWTAAVRGTLPSPARYRLRHATVSGTLPSSSAPFLKGFGVSVPY